MTAQRARVVMSAIPSTVGILVDFTQRFFSLSPAVAANEELSYALQLIVSETVTNVIRYAYGDVLGEVGLELQIEEQRAVIIVTDHGRPFDPRTVGAPDLDNPKGHGLGLFIVREHADAMMYEYKDNTNIFRLEKRFQ